MTDTHTGATHLSRKALAERWDTTPQRLANLASANQGPKFWKLGTRVLYPMTSVLAYEEAHMVSTYEAA